MAEEKRTEVQVVYAGRRFLLDERKLGHLYYFTDDEEYEQRLIFSRPLGTKSKRGKDVIGGMYAGEMCEKKSTAFGVGGWEFLGRSMDEDAVTRWHTADVGALGEMDKERKLKKAQRQNPMYERLQPIRDAYWQAPTSVGRRAILTEVLEFITKH